MTASKIATLEELVPISTTFKGKIGLIGGCFDVLHIGHIELLEFGKSKVDKLIVVLESDDYIKFHKGIDRPIFNQDHRAKVLSAITFVDHVLPINYGTGSTSVEIAANYINIIKKLGVTAIITNKKTDATWHHKEQWTKTLGIELILQNKDKISSSSEVISKLGL